MTRGEEILQRMIEAAGLENEEDMAAMFGEDEVWIRKVLPPALHFFSVFCEICEQDPARILGLDREPVEHLDEEKAAAIFKEMMIHNGGKLDFAALRELYSRVSVRERIGVAAGAFKAQESNDSDSEIAEMFAAAEEFEAAIGMAPWTNPIIEEIRNAREQLLAECGGDLDVFFKKILLLQESRRAAGVSFASFENDPPKEPGQEPIK